jgi:hypothetical protein
LSQRVDAAKCRPALGEQKDRTMNEIDVIQLKDGRKKAGHMIRISRDVAIRLIESLCAQIRHNNPNTERKEFFGKQGYFSVSVIEEPQRYTEEEFKLKQEQDAWLSKYNIKEKVEAEQ